MQKRDFTGGELRFLKKLAEGKKGLIPLDELRGIVRKLPGWSLVEGGLPRKISGFDDARMYEEKIKQGSGAAVVWPPNYSSKTWGFRTGVGRVNAAHKQGYRSGSDEEVDESERRVLSNLKKNFRVLPAKSSPPMDGNEGELVLIGASLGGSQRGWIGGGFNDEHEGVVVVDEVWVYRRGILISSPNTEEPCVLWLTTDRGRSVGNQIDSTDSNVGFNSFWTWVIKKSGLVQEAKAILESMDKDDLADATRAKSLPTAEHTGTCQVCGNLQKLKGGSERTMPVLVDHGYVHEKTAWGGSYWEYGELGHRVGHCEGRGYPPWELSFSRLEWVIEHIAKPSLHKHKEYLLDLKSGKITSLPDVVRRGRESVKVDVTPKDGYQWTQRLSREVYETEKAIEGTAKGIEAGIKAVDSWSRTMLYDERKAKKLLFPPFEGDPIPVPVWRQKKAPVKPAPTPKPVKSAPSPKKTPVKASVPASQSLKGKMVTSSDLKKAGYSPQQIKKMVADGVLDKVDFGWYRFKKEP